ncbi:acyltransferase [Agromyces sp. NPDC055520]
MTTPSRNIHDTADVASSAHVADDARVWHYAQVREDASIAAGCIVGRGAYIGTGVRLGRNCKIQNYALIYEPAVLHEGVFVGPGVVFTNDQFPRAINPDGSLKSGSDWEAVGVEVRRGAAIGAQSVCIAPVVIGEWSLVGSGSVVSKDVPAHALVVGNPARRIGWVGKTGHRLIEHEAGFWRCPDTGDEFQQTSENELREVTR